MPTYKIPVNQDPNTDSHFNHCAEEMCAVFRNNDGEGNFEFFVYDYRNGKMVLDQIFVELQYNEGMNCEQYTSIFDKPHVCMTIGDSLHVSIGVIAVVALVYLAGYFYDRIKNKDNGS